MYAGLENATGDYVVIMDADLQHLPAFLPKMYNIVLSGEYDCATTRRVSRKGEPKLLSWFSRKFYKIMKRDFADGNCGRCTGFSLYDTADGRLHSGYERV